MKSLDGAQVVAVSVGRARPMTTSLGEVPTGIWKAPVTGRIRVGRLSLAGDEQADLTVHGGADAAVYVYPEAHYTAWRAELARPDLPFGWFGENLTVRGVTEADSRLGDILRVGSALVQITKPRLPCFKLAAKMNDPAFPKRFLETGRVGWYLRVLEEGDVAEGDPVVLESADRAGVTVAEFLGLVFGAPDAARLHAALAIRGLPAGWKERIEQRLA